MKIQKKGADKEEGNLRTKDRKDEEQEQKEERMKGNEKRGKRKKWVEEGTRRNVRKKTSHSSVRLKRF